MSLRRLLLPALIAAPVLAALLWLGTWQLDRLHWKTSLLARIAAAEAGPATPLGPMPEPWTKVAVTGRLDHGRELRLALEARGGAFGAQLVTPLLREGAPPLLVVRGWVPTDRPAAIARPEGEVRVEGYVRPGERANLFSASDDLANRHFFTFDPGAIGAAIGLPGLAPFGIVALGPPSPGTLPDPARHLPRPSNNHLGYAITWYGLALSLVGVFVVWARRRVGDA
jgi:surfeit locus 1 family protein